MSNVPLWAALSESRARTVAGAFSTFLDQVGTPLISFDLQCEADKKPRLALSQERYLPLGSKADRNQTWQVPVCVKYPGGSGTVSECSLLTEKTGQFELQPLDRTRCDRQNSLVGGGPLQLWIDLRECGIASGARPHARNQRSGRGAAPDRHICHRRGRVADRQHVQRQLIGGAPVTRHHRQTGGTDRPPPQHGARQQGRPLDSAGR